MSLNPKQKAAKKRTLAKRDGCQCAYCMKARSLKKLTLDHVVPRCLGGTSCNDNLKLACRACNQKKANKPPHVFHAELMMGLA